jgi:two-component system sensor histidine kinase HupT/HoxJ
MSAHLESLAVDRAKDLMHTDRLANIGMMFSGLAHELKNPLTFISGNAQTLERFCEFLLTDDGADPDKAAFVRNELPGLFAGISSGVDRMVKLIDTFKLFTSKHVDSSSGVSVKAAIDAAMLMCGKRLSHQGVSVTVSADDEGKIAAGDQHQIEQVMVNLLLNAADAIESVEHGQIYVSIMVSENGVAVSVEDNGSGVPDRMSGEIWKPFVTTKPSGKGTGLGLAICRYIVEMHGGTISYYRNAFGGAGFVFMLPFHNSPSGGSHE